MFERVCAKSWMVKTIRDLFRTRSDVLRQSTWACVVRGGRVLVMKRFLTRAEDQEIMWALLGPGQIPSWFGTNWAVRKHWSILGPIALEGWRKSCAAAERASLGSVDWGT